MNTTNNTTTTTTTLKQRLQEPRPLLVAATCQRHDFGNLEKAEQPMVRFPGPFVAKQAEKQEHVANPHALVGKMRLRRPTLTEQACAVGQEHRIVVAQVRPSQPPLAGQRDVIGQTQLCIGGLREGASRDRQAHGTALDDRRRTSARRTVEPLAAENNAHGRSRALRLRARQGLRSMQLGLGNAT